MNSDSGFDRQALIKIFAAEASDGLEKLSAAIGLANDPLPIPAALEEQFIGAHGLKGAAALYGFERTAQLAGILEQICEHAGSLPADSWADTVVMARHAVEALRAQMDSIASGGDEDSSCLEGFESSFSYLTRLVAGVEASAQPGHETALLDERYLIPAVPEDVLSYFTPEAHEYLEIMTASLLRLEKSPKDAATIERLFRATHTLKGSAYTVGFRLIGDLAHHLEDLLGAFIEGRMELSADLADVTHRVVDVLRALLKRDPARLEDTRRECGAVFSQFGRVRAEALHEAPLSSAGSEPGTKRSMTGVPSQAERPAGLGASSKGDAVFIRVRRDRLEHLLNLVGELVIGRGRLEHRLMDLEQLSRQVLTYEGRLLASVRAFEAKHTFPMPPASAEGPGWPVLPQLTDFGDLEFDKYDDFNILARSMVEGSADVAEAMAQLTAAIRRGREELGQLQDLSIWLKDEIARTRMVPFSTLFTRFEKAVREMGRAAGKTVTLSLAGGAIELDTDLVQRVVDPLIHILRNAVHHGIESAETREAHGKPPAGTVSLRAAHHGNAVVIEVADDGTGLDLESIKARAIAMGVLPPEHAADLTETEVLKLIYLPGLSTAGPVGSQAGRGMGMDIVQRAVRELHGLIEVRTQQSRGTTFTLRFPLTLLISAALIVEAGDQRYGIPLAGIREVLTLEPGAIKQREGGSVVEVRGECIPLHSLAQLLGAASSAPACPGVVVVLRSSRGVLGVVVDALLGRQEIVIKSLGALALFKESCYCGAAVDTEGRVRLVLDVEQLAGRKPMVVGGISSAEHQAVSGVPSRPPHPRPLPTLAGREEVSERDSVRILLVDDSLSVRKFISRMLEAAGYHVDTAVDGEEGFRMAAAEPYSLIITDLEMPKSNGYELMQSLRELPQTRTTPIMVMTTRVADKHRQVARRLGAMAYLAKPVDEAALIREVERCMALGEPRGPAHKNLDPEQTAHFYEVTHHGEGVIR